MRIAVDAHCVGINFAGNGTYTINLVKNLVRIFPQHEWIIYISPEGKSFFKSGDFRFSRIRVLNSGKAWKRYCIEMPALLKKDHPDILHIQYYGPLFSDCPTVIMVHDISYEVLPEYFTIKERYRFKAITPHFMRRSRKILTVSEYSKREIIERYRPPREKVEVTLNGVDHGFYRPGPGGEDAGLLRSIGIDPPFFLFVGSLQPRKNIEGLLKAFAGAQESLNGTQMVVAGPPGWLSEGIPAILKTHPQLRSVVRFPGHVSPEILRALYRGCLALTYIPFYEGFGLPVLEAMACGAPVITSNVSSLPEVYGYAAIAVDPHDTDAIREALIKVARTPEKRAEMTRLGLIKAGEFSWEKTARSTMTAFEEVLAGR